MKRGFALGTCLLAACVAPSSAAVVPPACLQEVRPVRVEGPRYEGCAVALAGARYLTCTHVIPSDATEYKVGDTVVRRSPIAAGEPRDGIARIGEDWTLVAGPVADGTLGVDFRRHLEAGSTVWIVGWKRDNDGEGEVNHRRCVIAATIGERDERGYWCLRGMADADYAGLSGAPVVQVVGEVPEVVGVYCGYVVTRQRLLGIPWGERRDFVFLRPALVDPGR